MDILAPILALPWVQAMLQRLLIIVAATLIDAGFGVFLALKEGDFEWNKLADFMIHNTLPYTLAFAWTTVILNLVGPRVSSVPEWQNVISLDMPQALFYALMVSLVSSIVSKFVKFVPEKIKAAAAGIVKSMRLAVSKAAK